MTHTDGSSSPQRPSGRFGGPVLVSNLVAGAMFLGVLALLAWPLAVVGGAYVVVVSGFLAAAYARPALTRRQEVAAWVVPWLAAVALWTWMAAAIGGGDPSWLLNVWFGLVIATPCFLAWQAVALGVRHLLVRHTKLVSA